MTCLSYTRNPGRIFAFACLLIAGLVGAPQRALAADEFFSVLQIGTQEYKNVTVTTRAKDYIFILHSGGMGNIKVSQLPPEIREKLGYGQATSKTKSVASKAEAWARKSAAGQVVERQVRQALDPKQTRQQIQALVSPTLLVAVLGIALLFYVFYCYCAMLICEKTGNPPGILVWLPFVQIIPLLRAARMSPLWFVALLVPLVNILAQVVWSFKIAKARGKSAWVAFGLLLPVTNVIAFLYLAFSDAPKAQSKLSSAGTQIMTLEAA